MTNVWPLTGVGASSDWSFSGGGGFEPAGLNPADSVYIGGVLGDPPSNSDTAALTGSAADALDAAVPDLASCTVILTPSSSSSSSGDDGAIQVQIRGGDWTDIIIPWSGGAWTDPATAVVVAGGTSGIGGFAVQGNGGGNFDVIAFNDVSVVPAAGGSPYSLTCASGSFALSGTATGLKRGRKLTAASVSYTLSGTAVTFRRGRGLVAPSAAYSLSGTAAGLKYARIFSLASVAFVLSGTATGLKYGKRLAAASVAYVLSGTAATFKWGHNLPGSSATYLLSGTPATLAYKRIFTLGSASFAFAGTPVSLKQGHRLPAASASYILSGTAIGGSVTAQLAHAARLGFGLTLGL